MIQPVRGADSFARLRSNGRRLSRPSLWCTWCPDPHLTDPAVAFAITRKYGNAVERNRFRRRMRAILQELDVRSAVPSGLFLIGTTPLTKEQTFENLMRSTESMMTEFAHALSV